MSQLPGGNEPATKADLREFEARVDARFQAVNSRFTTNDRRWVDLRDRVDGMDHRWQSLADRVDARFRAVERRFDTTDAHIDLVHDRVAIQIDRSQRENRRTLLYGLAGSTATTASLCLSTVAFVI